MTPAEWRRAQAKLRVERALAAIERAQNELGMACSELSPICWGNSAWRRVGKLYDRVHAEWHRTRGLLDDQRVILDRDPTDIELAVAEKADTAPGPCETGCSPICISCHRQKAPVGRSVAPATHGAYCDPDCLGYYRDPWPCDLWPGEKREGNPFVSDCPGGCGRAAVC